MSQRSQAFRAQLPVVGAVAAGGALGAAARYAAVLAWPTPAGAFPWTILTVNAVGCALLGALLVPLTETWPWPRSWPGPPWPRPGARTAVEPDEGEGAAPHPLLRPFLGTGVCGGFTTFSTYALDTQRLLADGETARALLYLGGTAVTALAAVWTGVALARRAVRAATGADVRDRGPRR
ncbi:fluoride efflux transporter FluC [Streptomyces sp. NPDC090025]|uniref:fluoride efflux transporter FluC n=1 Tax=Streptomyces sp. NPDC090025 TaxID=3365922 RepID=UPI00383346EC